MLGSTETRLPSSTPPESAEQESTDDSPELDLNADDFSSEGSDDQAWSESDDPMARLPDFDEEIKKLWRDIVTDGYRRLGIPLTNDEASKAPQRREPGPPRQPQHRRWPPVPLISILREPSAPGSFDLSRRARFQLREPRASLGYLRAMANRKKVRFVEEPEIIQFTHETKTVQTGSRRCGDGDKEGTPMEDLWARVFDRKCN